MYIKKTFKIHLLAMLFILFSNSCYAASEPISPLSIAGVTKVNADELIELATKHHELIIIDSRISGDRQKGYIESSISLPNTKTNCDSLSKTLPTKSTATAFYCNGIKCGRSAIAVKIALKCGYKNLYWFRGGFEVWLEKGLPYMKD